MNTCPICDSYSTFSYSSFFEGSNFIVKKQCYDCKSEWTDTYRYDTSKVTKEEKYIKAQKVTC